jgi:hypothetical protein
MTEPGQDYGVKGSSADVADGLESFLLFFCASKVMLALSSQAYGWPVPDLSRRELIPNEDTASDRFLSVQDWPPTRRRIRGRARAPCLHKACMEHSNGSCPTWSLHNRGRSVLASVRAASG